MGKIFYIMGKSASGKDRLQTALKEIFGERLRTAVLYTTRPIRSAETEGVSYHFISAQRFEELKAAGKVIESRLYHTVHGPWIYATVDDGQIRPQEASYLIAGTLESYTATRDYFGAETVVPLYIEVEDGRRLQRALLRERSQEHPKYAEMCRRFLSDSEDFSEDNIPAAGIGKRYENNDFDECLAELAAVIRKGLQ